MEGPPVRFLENEDISLGLYPKGFQSATIFTNDDICAITPIESVERLRMRLKKLGVKGTFFVIPFHYGQNKLQAGQPQVETLKKLRADGHEIAQHGYMHYSRRNKGRGVKMGAEMLFLSREEQMERLKKGRKVLTSLGFPPRGHRSPCFSGTKDTFLALDELGYLYGSDLDLPATTPRTFLLPGFRGRILYPYHPSGLKLLEVTSQTDPTVRKKKVLKVFKRFHRYGGVFVFLTHVPTISEPENLDRLEEFLTYLKSRNTWLCPLSELCQWWLAREKLDIETKREGETLIITYDNPTISPLEDTRIVFKETDPSLKKYRVVNRKGKVLDEGIIPSSRKVMIILYPSEYEKE